MRLTQKLAASKLSKYKPATLKKVLDRMGNEVSSSGDGLEVDEEDLLDKFDGIDTLGYRVLGVQPSSPASAAGLVSFFDFLVGANGKMLLGSPEGMAEGDEYDDVDFPLLLRDSLDQELELLVWNIKSQSQRLVKITPSDSWGGTGLLGVTIRLDDYAGADERLIRVLSVEHNSPAAIAGLTPQLDYLLGTTTVSFDKDELLAAVLQLHVDRVVELYVYNTESDVVRVVTLMPTMSWGGRGLLGAQVGTGYLHMLPRSCRSTIGSSVERRVRTGARPTEQPPAAPQPPSSSSSSSTNLVMKDLTATSESSTGFHIEPLLEMEPEPATDHKEEEDEQSHAESEEESHPSKKDTAQQPQSEPTAPASLEPKPEKETIHTAQALYTSTPVASAMMKTASPPPKPNEAEAESLFGGPPPKDSSLAPKESVVPEKEPSALPPIPTSPLRPSAVLASSPSIPSTSTSTSSRPSPFKGMAVSRASTTSTYNPSPFLPPPPLSLLSRQKNGV
eukprot:scaffold173826_cov62-Attheya_sp.AAC.1